MKIKINKLTQERWDYLIKRFTPEFFENDFDDKEEYVEGRGNKKAFCYLVEAGTKDLGEIRGSNASKFGLWYGVHGEDKEKRF